MKLNIFFAYSHKDEVLLDELNKHLSMLKHSEMIQEWYDRKIVAGSDWNEEIDNHINKADLILLLISADFLASEYCYGIEMKRALERCKKEKIDVVAVILRAVDWTGAPFERFQYLPKDGVPVTSWANRDEALEDVAKGLRKLVKARTEQHNEVKHINVEDSGTATDKVFTEALGTCIIAKVGGESTVVENQHEHNIFEKSVTFTVGVTEYKIRLEAAPYIKDERTYLPIVDCARALGIPDSNIIWDSIRKLLTIVNGNKAIQFQVGSATMKINGVGINMDAPLEFVCGHVMATIRFISQGLGFNAAWDAVTQTVIFTL